jgi:hypothetical protein
MDRYTEFYSNYLQNNNLVERTFRLQEIMTYPPSPSLTNKWKAINKLRLIGMHHAERGCRKFRTGAIAWSPTLQLIRNRIEVWDLLRQSRHPAARCSNDAKLSYDRIVHSIASLCMQRNGVPEAPVVCMFTTLQNLSHYI